MIDNTKWLGTDLIARERARQRTLGHTDKQDDDQTDGQLATCAQYIVADVMGDMHGIEKADRLTWGAWPAERAFHVAEKYGDDFVQRLAIAGALLAAEIDRLLRLAAACKAAAESTPGFKP